MIDFLIWFFQFIGYMFFMVLGLKVMDLSFQVMSPSYRDYAIRRVIKKQRKKIMNQESSIKTET